MKLILRVVDPRKMKDYNLQTRKTPIQAGPFVAYKEDGVWLYQSEDVINANGKYVNSGSVSVYDAYYVDAKTDTKILIFPAREGTEHILSDAEAYTVGRVGSKRDKTTGTFKYGNSLELHDSMVSGTHCIFYKPNKKHLYVTDLDSTNGTFIDNRRLTPYKPQRLKQGEICAIGNYNISLETIDDEVFPKLLNMDKDAHLHPEFTAAAVEKARKYNVSIPELNLPFAPQTRASAPMISVGPRKLPPRPEYAVTIESAPSLNAQKPGLGSFGIGVNLPAMAIGFGMQAINYALGKKKYSKAEKERADFYARYTSKIENDLTGFHKQELDYAGRLYPGQSDCLKRLQAPYKGIWERHYGDDDFLSIRFGTGDRESSAQISIPSSRLTMYEDIFEHVPEQIKDKYSTIHNIPIAANLLKDGVLGVVGAKTETDALMRNLVLQIAALQNYDNVKLVLLCDKADLPQWGWMRWLPHNYNDTREFRYIITDPKDFEECFADEIGEIKERLNPEKGWGYGGSSENLPVYVFVVLNQDLLFNNVIGQALMSNREEINVTGIVAGRTLAQIPHSVRSIAEVRKNGIRSQIIWNNEEETLTVSNAEKTTELETCDRIARSAAPLRLVGASAKKKYVLPDNVGFFEGLGLHSKADIHPEKVWGTKHPEDSMSVPIGLDENGEQVMFDIHENAQGVHGLIAGGTGSGKSKMVQGWIGSMAYQFSPEDVNFVLVDFKGESLLTPFRKLPHVACFTSNLDPDVRRKFLAAKSELKRRQDLIREYNCNDLIDYRKLRRNDKSMPNIPFLILVVDEYASFKTEYPEFTEQLDVLFQQGRALGFFVILMTQNPSGKVTDQMRSNLGFRWCLRVDQESDSREVLETPDAAKIHNPGRAYFQAKKDGTYKLLQALYGAQIYDEERLQKATDDAIYALKPDGARIKFASKQKEQSAELPDELTVLSETLHDFCEKYHIRHAQPIWQPELPSALDLQELMKLKEDEVKSKSPVAALGLYDDPANQKQSLLKHDLWNDGTLAVYGAPQSGKTTFLETYMLSLARGYTPEKVQFYILEYGGFRLEPYKHLPHTGGYANDTDAGCIKRIIEYILKELSSRKHLFHKMHVSSCEGYEETSGTALPIISLVIDNLNSLLQQFSEYQSDIVKLVKEGASFGLLLIATVAGTNGMYSVSPFIRRSLGLRLSDKSDYSGLIATVRRDVSKLPAGRGFLNEDNEALEFQTAIIMAKEGDAKRYQEVGKWIEVQKNSYNGPLPEQILSLPEELYYGEIKGERYLLGLECTDIKPYSIHIEIPRSFLISYKDYKSNRTVLRSLIRQALDADAEIYLFSRNPKDYSDLLDENRLLSDLSDLEDVMSVYTDRLRDRQNQLKENPEAVFEPLVFIADGMYDIVMNGSETVNKRLEVFIRLGEKLNYLFIGCDKIDNMNEISISGSSILSITARDGYGMSIGGKIDDHKIIPGYRVASEYPGELKWDEAVVSTGDSVKLVKLMQGD